MANIQTIEVPVKGMDCAECVQHVEHALAGIPGVELVQVFLTSEKAVLHADPEQVTLPAIRKAVEAAGYSVPEMEGQEQPEKNAAQPLADFTRPILTLFGVVFGSVLFIVVVGEWLGLFEKITAQVPWVVGLAIVLIGGYPVFRNVVRAALRGQVISHTLMTLGVIAALAVGQWATAAVVVFFMRVGDYAERFTTERARRAVKDLTAMAPQTARVEREGGEVEVPVSRGPAGRDRGRASRGEDPGGRRSAGRAGDGQPGGHHRRIHAGRSRPGREGLCGDPGTAGQPARAHHRGRAGYDLWPGHPDGRGGRSAPGRRAAHGDKFSAYYLPVVAGIAALTYLLRRDPLATAAVLVVACSCSFALATPIAMLASIGAGAKRGLLIKGGKYLETAGPCETCSWWIRPAP